MRGLDWQAIDLLAEIYGCSDPEIFLAELMAMRNFFMEQPNE